MAVAGPNPPSSVASVAVGLGETIPWLDPENAASSDDSYATISIPPNDFISEFQGPQALRFTGFGFTDSDVPPGSTIDGLLFEVEVSQNGDAIHSGSPLVFDGSQINMWGGLGWEAGNAGFTPDWTDAYWPLGGPTDTAYSGPTQEMVVDPSFGIDLYFAIPRNGFGATLFVDHGRLTVYYSESAAYALTAEPGSFAVTGRTVGLRAARRLACGAGAFGLAGQPAALKRGARLPAASAAFSISGQSLAFSRALVLQAGIAPFAATGSAAALRAGRRSAMAPAAFAVTGNGLALRYGRSVAGGPGAFTLSGQAAATGAGRRLPASAGAFAFAGNAATLFKTATLSAGAFAWNGQAVGLKAARRLNPEAAAIALTGPPAGLCATRRIPIGPGDFALAGNGIAFRLTRYRKVRFMVVG